MPEIKYNLLPQNAIVLQLLGANPLDPKQGLQIRILHYRLEVKILKFMSEFEYDLTLQNVKLFQLLGDFVPRSPTGLRPGPTGGLPSPTSPQCVHPSLNLAIEMHSPP